MSKGAAKRLRVRLRELLEERGLSIQAFSRESGVCYPSAHDLVRDRARRVDFGTIETICSYFGKSIDEVLVLEESEPPFDFPVSIPGA